jgi:probable HAF family extracellular repeat protein
LPSSAALRIDLGAFPTNLKTLSRERYCEARAINQRGQVVGDCWHAVDEHDSAVGQRPFVWQNGTMIALPTLGPGGSMPTAINERNQIVGWSAPKGGELHAVLWTLKRG